MANVFGGIFRESHSWVIFTYISGIKVFPNKEFFLEHSQQYETSLRTNSIKIDYQICTSIKSAMFWVHFWYFFLMTTTIFDHVYPKSFDQLLVYVNLYLHVKNQAISLIRSGEMVD